jgi:hypothetical protein
MKLRVDPLSTLYAEYLLRVGNGQESSIIDHFPSKGDTEPSVEVKIALYSELHQAPSLDTFTHTVFLALVINYTNQGYMDGLVFLTTKNIVVNSLNTQIAKAVSNKNTYFCRQIWWKRGTTKLWRLTQNFSTPLLWQVCHHIA